MKIQNFMRRLLFNASLLFSTNSESEQIRICRVLCIFAMMSVHVNPGLGTSSVISIGDFSWLGNTWGNFFGRASVATLSFISGYLVIRTASNLCLAEVIRRRFGTLIVPMLTWNLIFCLLLAFKFYILQQPSDNIFFAEDASRLSLLTGLAGTTANEALFFLRDIFVALVIVKLLSSWLRRWPVQIIGLVFSLALFDLAEPVVFRSSILFFVFTGAAYAQRTDSLMELLTPWRITLWGLVLIGVLGALTFVPMPYIAMMGDINNLLRRCLLVLLMLTASAALSTTASGAWIAKFERQIFETYLLHVPLFGILWVVWQIFVGGPEETSYVVFFITMPMIAIMVGLVFGLASKRFPAPVQNLLIGKVRRPESTIPIATSNKI